VEQTKGKEGRGCRIAGGAGPWEEGRRPTLRPGPTCRWQWGIGPRTECDGGCRRQQEDADGAVVGGMPQSESVVSCAERVAAGGLCSVCG
jgi:hypothetical protein